MYLYPDNLKARATLWLWTLRDIGLLSGGLLLSIFVLTKMGVLLPLVITALYAFLSIRFEGVSILDFLSYAVRYFFGKPQLFRWRLES